MITCHLLAIPLLIAVLALDGHASPSRPGACPGPDPSEYPQVIQEFRRVMWFDSMDEFQTRAEAIHDSITVDPTSSPVDRALAVQCLLDAGEWKQKWRDAAHREFAYRGLRQIEEAFSSCHPEVARTLMWLSRIENIGFAAHARADSLLQIAEHIQADYYGPTSPEVGLILTYRVETMVAPGLEDEACLLSERAVEYTSTATAEQAFWPYRALGSLASCYGRRGDYGREVHLRRRAMEIITRDLPDMRFTIGAGTLHMAFALWNVGDLAAAQAGILKVIEAASGYTSAPFEGDFGAFENLGILRLQMGDWVHARQSLEEALRRIDRLQVPQSFRIGSWLGLAEIADREGRDSDARMLVATAAAELQQNHRTNGGRLIDLEQLVSGLLALDRPDTVLIVVSEMKRLADTLAVSPRAPLRGRMALFEAAAHRANGSPEQAIRVLSDGLALEADTTLDARNVRNEVRGALADLLDDAGRPEGRRLVMEYLEESRRLDRWAIHTLPERQAILQSGVRAPRLQRLLPRAEAAPRRDLESEEFLDQLVRSRRLVLDELAQHRQASWRRALEAAPEAVQAWRDAEARLRRFEHDPPSGMSQKERERQRLVLLGAALDREAEFIYAGASPAGSAASAEVGLRGVSAALGDSAALVSYVRLPLAITARQDAEPEISYHAAVHVPELGLTRVLTLGSASLVDSLVQSWRRDADPQNVDGDASSAGARLREIMWDPVAALLGTVTDVVLVPDGSFALVNPNALPMNDGRYLGEGRFVLRSVGAERDLVGESKSRASAVSGRGLVVAAPDFSLNGRIAQISGASSEPTSSPLYRGSSGSCLDFTSEGFEDLRGARLEGEEVAGILADRGQGLEPLLLTGPEASERRIKLLAGEARTLHFATHGYVVDSRCIGGAMSLEQTRRWNRMNSPLLIDNPLTRCGLALAGANRRAEAGPDEDDGLLTGDEIAALDLSGVEFVVLSACNTGVGEVLDGEGVLGLQRAFKIAGAGPVVMSLWPVEDQVARQWMRHFYEARLSEGVKTAAATSRASLAMLAERRRLGLSTRPSSWAPFVSVGVER